MQVSVLLTKVIDVNVWGRKIGMCAGNDIMCQAGLDVFYPEFIFSSVDNDLMMTLSRTELVESPTVKKFTLKYDCTWCIVEVVNESKHNSRFNGDDSLYAGFSKLLEALMEEEKDPSPDSLYPIWIEFVLVPKNKETECESETSNSG